MAQAKVVPAPVTQAAVHIELADAKIRSVKHQSGKPVAWLIEVEPANQNTTLADIDTILGEHYKAQITIEAEYEEPAAGEGAVDPRQGKLSDWSAEQSGANGDGPDGDGPEPGDDDK